MSNVDNSPARSGKHTERIRNRIKAKAGLSVAGMRWLEQVCDPFPDEVQSGFVGYPDENQAKSVVMELKQGINLTKPASLAAGKWSALIFTSGNLRPGEWRGSNAGTRFGQPFASYGYSELFGADWVGQGLYPVQPLTIFTALDGEHLFPDNDAIPWNVSSADRFTGLDFEDWVKNRCRLIGGAIEVHDTSPELYKSGSLTVGDVSSAFTKTMSIVKNDDVAGSQLPYQCFRFNAPPATLAEATLLPGSRTWEAKEGVYAVLKQSKQDNPYLQTEHGCPLWADAYPAVKRGAVGPYVVGAGCPPKIDVVTFNPGGGSVTTTLPFGVPVQPTPFDIKFILLSGLDPNASYRINLNCVIEAIPDLDDKQLLVLAKPAPALDHAAIELYSEIMGELPAGVPVRENLSGDWFAKVLGALDKYAGPIGNTLGALGVPMASLIGQGVSKGAAMGKAALDERKANKSKTSKRN